MAAFAAGAHAYALKDINLTQLGQVIESVDEGAVWIDPAIASIVMGNICPETNTFMAKLQSQSIFDGPQGGDAANPVTDQEKEVLQLIVQGQANADIAAHLGIGVDAVKAHVRSILDKLCENNQVRDAVNVLKHR